MRALYVNAKPARLTVDDERILLWVLRYDLGLTRPKFGCGAGLCGSCTAIADKNAVRSCAAPIAEVAGKRVLTIEGLSRDDRLHSPQEAFLEHHASPCGFCTPGMILKAYSKGW